MMWGCVAAIALGGCEDAVTPDVASAPTEEVDTATQAVLPPPATVPLVVGFWLPTVVNGSGVTVSSGVAYQFNPHGALPGEQLTVLAERASALVGEVGSPNTNGVAVLKKLAAHAVSGVYQTASGAKRQVAVVKLPDLGVLPPEQLDYTKLATWLPSVVFNDKGTKRLLRIALYRMKNASQLVIGSSPTPSSGPDALFIDPELLGQNGASGGKGVAFRASCSPLALFPTGEYDSLANVPGTSPLAVGPASVSFATIFFNDTRMGCSL